MGQAVLVKPMPADRPNLGRFFFYHFEFKIQNNCGSVLCKKLLLSKIAIVDVSRTISPNIFIKHFNFAF